MWTSSAVRPTDGPESASIGYRSGIYKVGDIVYIANFDAPWHTLTEFPPFDDKEFFASRPATEFDITNEERDNDLAAWQCCGCQARIDIPSHEDPPGECQCGWKYSYVPI